MPRAAGAVEAALEACKLRLRAIIITFIAFTVSAGLENRRGPLPVTTAAHYSMKCRVRIP